MDKIEESPLWTIGGWNKHNETAPPITRVPIMVNNNPKSRTDVAHVPRITQIRSNPINAQSGGVPKIRVNPKQANVSGRVNRPPKVVRFQLPNQPTSKTRDETTKNRYHTGLTSQPNSGVMNQPNSGVMNQPNSGVMNQPNSGVMNQPNSGVMNQPNSGVMNNQPIGLARYSPIGYNKSNNDQQYNGVVGNRSDGASRHSQPTTDDAMINQRVGVANTMINQSSNQVSSQQDIQTGQMMYQQNIGSSPEYAQTNQTSTSQDPIQSRGGYDHRHDDSVLWTQTNVPRPYKPTRIPINKSVHGVSRQDQRTNVQPRVVESVNIQSGETFEVEVDLFDLTQASSRQPRKVTFIPTVLRTVESYILNFSNEGMGVNIVSVSPLIDIQIVRVVFASNLDQLMTVSTTIERNVLDHDAISTVTFTLPVLVSGIGTLSIQYRVK